MDAISVFPINVQYVPSINIARYRPYGAFAEYAYHIYYELYREAKR